MNNIRHTKLKEVNNDMQIVTRFAPSPTGFLHIGGARTALFNWLYAKANGGKMRLRIEDTDRERSSDAAIAAIMDGLKWLELNWDEETVFQHSRSGRHAEVAERLLMEGKAYKCYCSPEELARMREKAREEGRAPGYDGRWRDRAPSEAPAGIKPAIRFKAPDDGNTVIEDMVQGKVTFANKDLDDLILLRSDGSPTYMLSVVVDDYDMGVTHVIRGDDHFTNAARQSQIYAALGWSTPAFAHVPLIHGADGAKLSKRHGALGVEAYRDMGYLPAALRNYLVRLGWSHGDEEIFSTEQMLKWFDLDAIGRSAARMDFKKLESLNGYYIRQSTDDELVAHIKHLLPTMEDAPDIDADGWCKLQTAMPGLKERAKTLVELIDNARFIFARRPLAIEPKAAQYLDDTACQHLANLLQDLEEIEDWKLEDIENIIRAFAERSGVKLGKIAQPLRAALTGKTTSPGIFDVLFVLGKRETLKRISEQI
jgi:glutamyl-tRNA synthetase